MSPVRNVLTITREGQSNKKWITDSYQNHTQRYATAALKSDIMLWSARTRALWGHFCYSITFWPPSARYSLLWSPGGTIFKAVYNTKAARWFYATIYTFYYLSALWGKSNNVYCIFKTTSPLKRWLKYPSALCLRSLLLTCNKCPLQRVHTRTVTRAQPWHHRNDVINRTAEGLFTWRGMMVNNICHYKILHQFTIQILFLKIHSHFGFMETIL